MISLKNRTGIFIKVTRDVKNEWIYAQWFGQLSVKDVKEGALVVAGELKESGYTKLLNDNTKIIGHWDDANEWIASVWVPKALENKLQKFAHVLSAYLFGQASAEQMQINVGNSFQMRLFDDIPTAEEWLKEDL